MIFSSNTEIKIPFFDLDPMNVVWHGNYIKYMEIARCDLFSKIGYTYADMLKDNLIYPVVKMETKFIQPMTFEQEIIIKTELLETEPALIIKYAFFDKVTNKKLFSAKTMQMACNSITHESQYQAPAGLIESIKRVKK